MEEQERCETLDLRFPSSSSVGEDPTGPCNGNATSDVLLDLPACLPAQGRWTTMMRAPGRRRTTVRIAVSMRVMPQLWHVVGLTGRCVAGSPSPMDLYGKFTWKIENFSEISKRELRSNVFEVGSYKW